jgi:hypothetical protein
MHVYNYIYIVVVHVTENLAKSQLDAFDLLRSTEFTLILTFDVLVLRHDAATFKILLET